MRLYISNEIDLGSMEELKGRNNGRNRNPYKFWYILSTIYFISVVDHRFNKQKHPFIPLNAKKLHKILGRYDLYINYLIKRGVIECDNYYISQQDAMKLGRPAKSKGYRLTEKYKNAKFTLCREDHGLKLDETNKDETEKYIEECLAGLFINESRLQKVYENMSQKEIERADKIVDLIREECFFTSRSEKTGRLFSNITCLNRELKEALLFFGENVSMADIKSCQPAILYSFYPDKNIDEAKKYKFLIESGEFYEFFVNACAGIYKDRNKIKKPFYALWFGHEDQWTKRKWSWSLRQLQEVFSNNFPILWSEMQKLKKDDYAFLARELQRRESNLIFNKVVKWCKDNKIKCLTIHDCIISSSKDIEVISAKMEEVFDSALGLKSKITTENY